jgi:hypothetical protein
MARFPLKYIKIARHFSSKWLCLAWWCLPAIPVLRGLRQDDDQLKARLGIPSKTPFQTKTITKWHSHKMPAKMVKSH